MLGLARAAAGSPRADKLLESAPGDFRWGVDQGVGEVDHAALAVSVH